MIKATQYTEKEQAQFQTKLSYILKKFRIKNQISSKEMAFHLGYSPSRYSKIESGSIVYDRFIHSLELLKTFASLEGMELHEFINFLYGNKIETEKGILRKWEDKALSCFRKLKMNVRIDFIDSLEPMTKSEKELLEGCLGLFLKFKKGKVEGSTLHALITLMEGIGK